MTDDDYKTWAAHHATLFLMTSDTDQALFKVWKALVLPYALQDFLEGSDHIAQEKSSAFRTTHLDLIRGRINARRVALAAQRMNDENAGARYECGVCRGVGMVIVPHQDFVRDGLWLPPYPTMGICCLCNRGRARFDSILASIEDAKKHPDKRRVPPPPLSWEKYEALVPRWLRLMDDRESLAREEIKGRKIAAHADRVDPLRRVLDKVLEEAVDQRGELQ